MDHLDSLESESIYILREAFNKIERLAMLWSIGKDSNTLVWLAMKAFFGRVPFPLIHLDTEDLSVHEAEAVGRNDLAEIVLRTQSMLTLDPYRINAATGRFMLVDNFAIVGGVTTSKGSPLSGRC